MKYLKALNDLVEIKTSIAIFTSTIIGSLYGFYNSHVFHWNFIIAFLLCTVSLDAVATVFNHIYDYYKAIDKEGYLYTIHNPIVYHQVKPLWAIFVGFALLGLAGVAGLYLVIHTSLWLLLIGVVSALIALLYSAGKIPISYYPISELISGFFEGSIVIMVCTYLQTGSITVTSLLISLPITLSISNIMLANNITDIEEDLKNKRKTLPILLGRNKAIYLFILNSILMFVLTFIYIYLKDLSIIFLGILVIIPLMVKHLRLFLTHLTKAKGFVFALKNSLLFNITYIILFLIQIIYFLNFH